MMFVRASIAGASVALAGLTGSASAMLTLPSSAARAVPIGGFAIQNRATMTVYEGIPGPYSAFAAATGPAGIDDYASIESGPFRLAQFKFVGGVTSVGGPMTVEFLNSSSTVVNGFTAALPSAGDFIWTITLGAAPDGSDSTFVVPRDGFIRLTVGANTTGRWFLTTTPPTIGSNNFTVGTGSGLSPQRNNTFALVAVPSPGAGALLGLGGLFALRRRR